MPYKACSLLLFFLLPLIVKSQTFSGKNYGLNIGLHVAAGTHFTRIGLSCNGYYIHKSYQVNPGFKIYYNLKNIGPAKKYFEFAPSIGIIFSFGKNDALR